MSGLGFSLFSIVWILTLVSMILFKNKVIVFEWEKGLKVYFEDNVCDDVCKEDGWMKRGLRPTRRQKEFLSNKKLDPIHWLVINDRDEYMEIINKNSHKVRRVLK